MSNQYDLIVIGSDSACVWASLRWADCSRV